ncbi:conserved hypothetical protein [Vibrio crassostreae]|nr:hypothetical protein EDB40_101271 [Vibrio crassostreae]CAK2018742.1 conserved hypothetical protein [Vibrio crassostreae]CAK2071480.1 conserved hypothetical protein [Vibrio crassostreae]CAK2090490.1 conserved hypothetical protein [Vibrio crassostreae]CAK2148332.1 conserved hypothetical protein [Vibrio crassostreae]
MIMISGINSGNCILSSMAKERVKSGIIDHAQISGMKSAYTVVFDGSEWNGEPLVLSSSRQPYEPRIFKSLDGALAELLRIGITEASIKITDGTDSK